MFLFLTVILCSTLFIQSCSSLNGGKPAAEGQFPYIVSLRNPFTYRHVCAGIILAPEWVLSAAHCFVRRKNFLIVPGRINSPDNPSNVYHSVKNVTIHPDFNLSDVFIANDLALLELQTSLNFTSNVSSIALGSVKDKNGIAVELAGWGAEEPGLPTFRKLRYGVFETMVTEKCREIHDEVGNIVDGRTQICVTGGRGKSACAGDSGGPLIKQDTKKLVGMFSGYEDCDGKFPTLHVRLAVYADWLRNVTGLELPLD